MRKNQRFLAQVRQPTDILQKANPLQKLWLVVAAVPTVAVAAVAACRSLLAVYVPSVLPIKAEGHLQGRPRVVLQMRLSWQRLKQRRIRAAVPKSSSRTNNSSQPNQLFKAKAAKTIHRKPERLRDGHQPPAVVRRLRRARSFPPPFNAFSCAVSAVVSYLQHIKKEFTTKKTLKSSGRASPLFSPTTGSRPAGAGPQGLSVTI